jgi:hypothetical protein
MSYFCYACVQLRSLCPPGKEPGGCAAVEAEAELYFYERDHGPKRVYLGSVPGGTTAAAKKRDQSREFDAGLHAYREAKRAGEQPDNTSVAGVEKARRRQEQMDKVQRRVDRG